MVHWNAEVVPEDVDYDGLFDKFKATGSFPQDFLEGMKLVNAPPHPQIELTVADRIKALGPDPPKDKQGNVVDGEWTEVNLSGWKLDHASIRVMSKVLPKAASISSLILVNVEIGTEGIGSLAEFLPATNVTTLNLDWNNSGAAETKSDVYGSRLAGLIGPDSKLMSLSLRSNKIGDKGAIALSQALRSNFKLGTLNLFDNSITDRGGAELVKALVHNVALRELLLGKNSLGNVTLDTLAAVFSNYPLESNEVEERKAIEAQWAVAKKGDGKKAPKGKLPPPELPPLTTIEEVDGKFFVQGNQTLEVVNIGYNDIDDEGISSFCTKLTSQKEFLSPKLGCVAIHKNNLSDTAKATLQTFAEEINTKERPLMVLV